jgi:hypothetical protein
VIGGGIAGTGAAWALSQQQMEVTLFEPRPILGGNAKTAHWPASGRAAPAYRTGLSVLAWPRCYFHTYEALLRRLKIPTEVVRPKFLLSDDGVDVLWAHGEPNARWARDMRSWDRAVDVARFFNRSSIAVGDVAGQAFDSPRAAMRMVAGLLATPSLALFVLFKSIRFGTAMAWASARKATLRTLAMIPFLNRVSSIRAAAAVPAAGSDSLYAFASLNPLNFISARRFVRLCGCSDEFWAAVAVPVYSSSFLTAELDELPAAILPALDDIISIGVRTPVRPLNTWSHSSADVFAAMASSIHSVHTNVNVTYVATPAVGGGHPSTLRVAWTAAESSDEEGRPVPSSREESEEFDHVIFACPGPAAQQLLVNGRGRRSAMATATTTLRTAADWAYFRALRGLVGNITYEHTRDYNFTVGDIHSDLRVIPGASGAGASGSSAIADLFYSKLFSNYVRRLDVGAARPTDLVNVFSLGTWVPEAMRAAAVAGVPYMHSYVSYDAERNRERLPNGNRRKETPARLDVSTRYTHAPRPALEACRGTVDNAFGHPRLNQPNMLRMLALRSLQGDCGIFFCGNYTTPANGHDLSLLSGFVAAAGVLHQQSLLQPRKKGPRSLDAALVLDALFDGTDASHDSRALVTRDFTLLRGLMGV